MWGALIAGGLGLLGSLFNSDDDDDKAVVEAEKDTTTTTTTNKNTQEYYDWLKSIYEEGYKEALTNYYNYLSDRESEWSRGAGGAIRLGMSTGGRHTRNAGVMVPKWARQMAIASNPYKADVEYYSDLLGAATKNSEMSETTAETETTSTETATSDDDWFSFSDILNAGALYYGSKRAKTKTWGD